MELQARTFISWFNEDEVGGRSFGHVVSVEDGRARVFSFRSLQEFEMKAKTPADDAMRTSLAPQKDVVAYLTKRRHEQEQYKLRTRQEIERLEALEVETEARIEEYRRLAADLTS